MDAESSEVRKTIADIFAETKGHAELVSSEMLAFDWAVSVVQVSVLPVLAIVAGVMAWRLFARSLDVDDDMRETLCHVGAFAAVVIVLLSAIGVCMGAYCMIEIATAPNAYVIRNMVGQ